MERYGTIARMGSSIEEVLDSFPAALRDSLQGASGLMAKIRSKTLATESEG
jgi:hypothetical protein